MMTFWIHVTSSPPYPYEPAFVAEDKKENEAALEEGRRKVCKKVAL